MTLAVAELLLQLPLALVHAQVRATAAGEALGAAPAMTCQQDALALPAAQDLSDTSNVAEPLPGPFKQPCNLCL
jgi:hypothetical protein